MSDVIAETAIDLVRVDDGQDGTDGRSIVSTTRYYILSAAAPAEPSAEWDMIEPIFNPATDIDKTLYFADYTTFSDEISAWSEISASSSYEAAKTAHLEAVEAAKTATNYIGINSNGLVVGDMTENTLGNHVLIDSDSVDIRNGDNVLASFGANTIYLGKNNQDTIIEMCGNAGRISVREILQNDDTYSSTFTIEAEEVLRLKAPKANLIDSSHDDDKMESYAGIEVVAARTLPNTSVTESIKPYIHLTTAYTDKNSKGSLGGLLGGGAEIMLTSDRLYIGISDSIIGNSQSLSMNLNESRAIFSSGDALEMTHNGTGNSIGVGVGSGGINKGIYNYDAKKWMIYSNDTDLYLGPPIYSSFRPYYSPGDTIDIKLITAGLCLNSGLEVYFTVPLPKQALSYSGISVSSTDGFKLFQNGKWTHGSSSSGFVKPSSYTVYLGNEGKSFTIRAKFSKATNAETACPIAIHWRGAIDIPVLFD